MIHRFIFDRIKIDSQCDGDPADIAFIAMALKKIGSTVQAEEQYQRLLDLMQKPEHANNESDRAFLSEAQALLTQ